MIELIVQNQNGAVFDISDLVTHVDLEDNVQVSSVLKFDVIKTDTLGAFFEGNTVRFKYRGEPFFYGYVFKKRRDKEQVIAVTCYDQLRYLKTKDTYVFENAKASEMVKVMAEDFNLKMGNITDTGYSFKNVIEDSKNLLDITGKYLDMTLAYTKQMYLLKDNMGRLELRNVSDNITDLVVGEESLLIDYDYETEIDTDTYNQVKLVRNNQETGKRDVYLVKDSSTISRWGLLQHYEVLNEAVNDAQAIEKADVLLSLKNRLKRNLKIEMLGDKRLRAGNVIFFNVTNLGDISVNQFLLVTKAKHEFTNNDYIITADLRIL